MMCPTIRLSSILSLTRNRNESLHTTSFPPEDSLFGRPSLCRRSALSPSYSPLWLPAYFIRSPVVLAWVQVGVALTAGLGMFVFCRRVVRVGFWAAAVVAWCYPITGAYIVWEGWWLPAVMCWLPWMLVAVHATVRRPTGWGGPAIALLTAVVLISGASDVAGQVLLTSGIFASWCVLDHYGLIRWPAKKFAVLGVLTVAWAWASAAAPWIMLPFQQYVKTGSRISGAARVRRNVPPSVFRNCRKSFCRICMAKARRTMSASLRMRFPKARWPLTWASGQRWLPLHWVWAAAAIDPSIFSSSCSRSFPSVGLNIPGMVQILRLPVLNMMSHNRLVFVASLAVLAMAAVGLERLFKGTVRPRWWFELPVILLVLVAGWCYYRAVKLPPEIGVMLGDAISAGTFIVTIRTREGVAAAQMWFREKYIVAGTVAIVGLAYWYWMRRAAYPPMDARRCPGPHARRVALLRRWLLFSEQSGPLLSQGRPARRDQKRSRRTNHGIRLSSSQSFASCRPG